MLSSFKVQLHREYTHLTLPYKITNNFLLIPTGYLPTPSPIASTRLRNDMKFLHYQITMDSFNILFSHVPFLNGTTCQQMLMRIKWIASFRSLLYKLLFCNCDCTSTLALCPRWALLIKIIIFKLSS